MLGGGFKDLFFSPQNSGKISNLTNIFFRWVVQPPTSVCRFRVFSFVPSVPDTDLYRKMSGQLNFLFGLRVSSVGAGSLSFFWAGGGGKKKWRQYFSLVFFQTFVCLR